MKLIKVKNYNELSEKAFQIVIKEILKKPNLVIGFAAGKSPLGLYRKLTEAYKNGEIDFSKVKSFNLDEYYPIKKKNKKSFSYFLSKNLFNKINIKKENINLLNGEARNFKKECRNYENKIRKNPIDMQILGVGVNGHIGFNEPGSNFNSKTRLVDLSEESVRGKSVSKSALTVGISTIMKSKKIILLAFGNKKAKAVRDLIKGKIDKNCPVSFLKKHKNLFVIMDGKAGSLL
jgi:glucosamine-6-phosphate deaminase